MRVLIYGSTYLTQKCVEYLLRYPGNYELIGYIPAPYPTVPGIIPLPLVFTSEPHDIGINLGYEQRIDPWDNVYNIHPGLLPEFGGCDLLHHTVVQQKIEQGITFQKMEESFDSGPILAKVTYPVFRDDDVLSLWQRVLRLYGPFVRYCLELLETFPLEKIVERPCIIPRRYKRGKIQEKYRIMYQNDIRRLKEFAQCEG